MDNPSDRKPSRLGRRLLLGLLDGYADSGKRREAQDSTRPHFWRDAAGNRRAGPGDDLHAAHADDD